MKQRPPQSPAALGLAAALVLVMQASGAVIWQDGFTDGNDTVNPSWTHWTPWGAGTGSPSWSAATGAYEITGQAAGFAYGIGSYVAQTVTDCHAGALMTAVSPNLQNDRGLLVRLAPGTLSFYGLTIDPGGSSIDLLKYVNGATVVNLHVAYGFTVGGSYRTLLETVDVGSSVLVRAWFWADGSPRPADPVLQFTDASNVLASGFVGLIGYTEEASTIRVRFDDLYVASGAVPDPGVVPEPSTFVVLVAGLVNRIRRRRR